MHNIDRRQLLKTTGVGAGIALGAGTTSMGGVAASTSSDSLSADTVETITTTSQSGSVAISEETTADFRQEAYAVSGDAITLQGEVDSTAGTWTSTNVDFGDVASLVESLDLQAVVSDVLAKLDLENSVDNLLLDDLLDDIITILDAPDWTQTQLNGLEVLITELIAEYAPDLSGVESFVVGLLENPDKATLETIIGFVLESGEIQEGDTLGDLLSQLGYTVADLEQTVLDAVAGLDPSSLLSSATIDIQTGEVSGEYDVATDLMTANLAQPTISVSYAGTDIITLDLPVDLTLTTGTSGSLTGSVNGSLDDSQVDIELVENEFVLGLDSLDIDQIVSDMNVEQVILDLLDSFGVTFNIDPADYDGIDLATIEEVIQAIDLDTELDFVDISATIDSLTFPSALGLDQLLVDESGRHALILNATVSGGAVLDIDPIGEGPPQDHDGDGKFEDVLGNGQQGGPFNVQGLFSNLNDPRIQNNAAAFNFSGKANPEQDGVTVFDVQALFNMS